jgi:hypothetical protein
MVKHNSKSQQRQQFRNGGSSSQQILTMGAPASSHGPWPSYQGVHDLAFFSFVPSIGSLAHSAVHHFACLPAYLGGRDHYHCSPLDCCCLLCCVLLLQKQVLATPLLCFFSSVSHPLSLNLTRFSLLLFAINFFLNWGLGTATIMQRYFKRKALDGPSPSTDQRCLNWEDEIEFDPGKRKEISKYHPNIRDVVRRKVLGKWALPTPHS